MSIAGIAGSSSVFKTPSHSKRRINFSRFNLSSRNSARTFSPAIWRRRNPTTPRSRKSCRAAVSLQARAQAQLHPPAPQRTRSSNPILQAFQTLGQGSPIRKSQPLRNKTSPRFSRARSKRRPAVRRITATIITAPAKAATPIQTPARARQSPRSSRTSLRSARLCNPEVSRPRSRPTPHCNPICNSSCRASVPPPRRRVPRRRPQPPASASLHKRNCDPPSIKIHQRRSASCAFLVSQTSNPETNHSIPKSATGRAFDAHRTRRRHKSSAKLAPSRTLPGSRIGIKLAPPKPAEL